jgi:hypothetical protein
MTFFLAATDAANMIAAQFAISTAKVGAMTQIAFLTDMGITVTSTRATALGIDSDL